MFQNPRYMTRGVLDEIPYPMIYLIWYMVEQTPEPRDYLQMFELSIENGKQKIVHRQEEPFYEEIQLLTWENPLEAKLYAIDDGDHSILLRSCEY